MSFIIIRRWTEDGEPCWELIDEIESPEGYNFTVEKWKASNPTELRRFPDTRFQLYRLFEDE